MKLDVRNGKGEQIALTVGKWYAGINWLENIEDDGAGAIAQYQGENCGLPEFYDEDGETLVRLQDYEYLVEQF